MNKILCSNLMFWSVNCFAGSEEAMVEKLIQNNLYYSAIEPAKQILRSKNKLDQKFEIQLDKIVSVTGVSSLDEVDIRQLEKSNSSGVSYVLAKRYLDLAEYEKAISRVERISSEHKYYSESFYLKGNSLLLLKKNEEAIKSFLTCQAQAVIAKNKTENEKIKRFYNLILEKCIVGLAREAYGRGEYKKAIEYYDQIEKNSYIWPSILIEKAWSYYNLNDYNRTLGILTTYKAPLLESYFYPEAEILSGLAYLQLCLWSDTLIVIKKFHEDYAPQSELLKNILTEKGSERGYFFNLMFSKNKNEVQKNPFIKKLLTQIRKETYFNFLLKYYRVSLQELSTVKEMKENEFSKQAIQDVETEHKVIYTNINNYIREKMFYFVNDMNRLSEEMYNIQLELFTRKKDVLYASRSEVLDRSRGSFENIEKNRFQYFWKFNGEFWADELGDYVFGLKSNCQESKI